MSALACRVNLLRAQRHHLEAHVAAGVDGPKATLAEAREALNGVNAGLAAAEDAARELPELAYLFRRGRPKASSKTGLKAGIRTHVPPPQFDQDVSTTVKEAGMARKSKKVELEETLEALRKAEKNAGSTKWALSGAGAKKNPPSEERAAHLTEKLAREQAQIAELRAKRDALKG